MATAALLNYVILVPPVSVFYEFLGDIYSSLNIVSGIVVLYDDMYGKIYSFPFTISCSRFQLYCLAGFFWNVTSSNEVYST